MLGIYLIFSSFLSL
jgi:hypothetical protein